MKLFGKRKSPSASQAVDPPDQPKKEEEAVSSYFSSDFKPPSSSDGGSASKANNTANEIETLLAMESSELNAKQRRIIRRHMERNGEASKENENNDKDTEKEAEKVVENTGTTQQEKESKVSKVLAKDSKNDVEEKVEKPLPIVSEGSSKTETTSTESNKALSAEDIAQQLKGLNSKERRKLLRKLASEAEEDDSKKTVLTEAIELSKKIAEENEAKQSLQKKDSKTTNGDNTKASEDNDVKDAPNPSADKDSLPPSKKKRKLKDLSHLPPDERKRREKQRKMQQEAAERRASGDQDMTRHPLNSERRRANKRKPGRAGKIVALKRQTKENQRNSREFSAGGYTMRHMNKP